MLGANDSSLCPTTSVCRPRVRHGTLCIVGGVTGYARTRSIPSIAYTPGPRITCSVGALYLYSGDYIRKHTANGLEFALGASALLFLSSHPRFSKDPIPAMLTVTSAVTGAYYGRAIYKLVLQTPIWPRVHQSPSFLSEWE
ncbi:hypothetical protein DFH94DRAFT_763211 [Russula ochroleuca]|uniref:Uncharacterized protein n=1 Tax=Russula ochroleuca TaxID=152965 RepID=A0A9P5K198_9AGAM|nr:hypothetical protein DFH94DRAFT_763211 [Russula ochroleuca]